MGKSLRSRLNGNTQQFVEDVGKYGIWSSMEKYGLKDYLAARKIVLEETGDENYGLRPKLAPYNEGGIKGVLREMVSAFADYVVKSEAEKRMLKKRLAVYQGSFQDYEIDCADQIVSITNALRGTT